MAMVVGLNIPGWFSLDLRSVVKEKQGRIIDSPKEVDFPLGKTQVRLAILSLKEARVSILLGNRAEA